MTHVTHVCKVINIVPTRLSKAFFCTTSKGRNECNLSTQQTHAKKLTNVQMEESNTKLERFLFICLFDIVDMKKCQEERREKNDIEEKVQNKRLIYAC